MSNKLIITLWLEIVKPSADSISPKRTTWTRTLETGMVPGTGCQADGVLAWGSPYGEMGPLLFVETKVLDGFGNWHVNLQEVKATPREGIAEYVYTWSGGGQASYNLEDGLRSYGWRNVAI